ncbi:MAG: CRISPR-associated endonuclease Cas2 [Mariprofundaceae bacterium]|nr:CRISPR-associated endonuclease Cas2 [Mariprofundaceae bacterium]
MDVLLTYDVNTETKAGRRRLRHIAKLCLDYGQRVQWSVFECSVDAMQFDQLCNQARSIINHDLDSIRIYRLHGGHHKAVQVFGKDSYVDFTAPLIL